MKTNFPNILAIAGHAGAGKDTVAEMFEEILFKSAIFRFASPIYDAIETIFDINLNELDRAEKELPHWKLFYNSPRKVLQTLGTEWAREMIHEDVWPLLLDRRLRRIAAQGEHIKWAIIPDLRFENELQYVRSRGGSVVRVERHSISVRPHASEAFHIAGDFSINNNSTLETTRKQVQDIATSLENHYGTET